MRELANASLFPCDSAMEGWIVSMPKPYAPLPIGDARCVPIPFGCSLHSIALHYLETTDIRRLVLSITVLP